MYKLSKTSKMVGSSFSLPATTCKVGSILSEIKGSVCSSCYAKKGSYCYPSVRDLRQNNYDEYMNNPDSFYSSLKTIIQADYLKTGVGYFRWFDSGDVQSQAMLVDIIRIAKALPHIKFWLPTKEVKIVKDTLSALMANKISFPTNLNIRVSVFMINGEYNSSLPLGLTQSRVITKDITPQHDEIVCSGKCVACKCSCWDSTKNVAYIKH